MNNDAEIAIMFIDKEKIILPINSKAFTVTQSTARELNKTYGGARVIWKNGRQETIVNIFTNGLYGDSFLSKIWSVLFGIKSINVEFNEEDSIDIEDLKKLIVKYIKLDAQKGDPYFQSGGDINDICEKVIDSKDVLSIFNALNVPTPDDCLDVL